MRLFHPLGGQGAARGQYRVCRRLWKVRSFFLGEVAERTNRLEVLCRKCDRRGVLSVARLVQEHGANFGMPELRRVLAGDCPRLAAGKFS